MEPRGKYAGVKIHLDGEEAQSILTIASLAKTDNGPKLAVPAINFIIKLGKKIKGLLVEHPNLLEDRTEEEVKEALYKDQDKIEAQLAAMEKGKDWKGV